LTSANTVRPITCEAHLRGIRAQKQKTMLTGPKNMGGRGSEAEGLLGESLGVVAPPATGSVKALQVYPDNDSGEANSSTKIEGTQSRCDNQSCNDVGHRLETRTPKPTITTYQEGGGGNLGLERRYDFIGEEGAIMEDGYKTPVRFRRLRALWELGVTIVRPRWRSKGGLWSFHYGISSSFMLSLCSNAESDSDIIKCNNRLRFGENVAESIRLWDLDNNWG